MTKHVLVVDDNADFRLLMTRLLRNAGFECREAVCAEQALERLSEGSLPDLIVTDLHMGSMSGCDLLHRLRAEPTLRAIPILLVSNDDAGARTARESGFDSFVGKTQLGLELAPKVHAILDQLPIFPSLQ